MFGLDLERMVGVRISRSLPRSGRIGSVFGLVAADHVGSIAFVAPRRGPIGRVGVGDEAGTRPCSRGRGLASRKTDPGVLSAKSGDGVVAAVRIVLPILTVSGTQVSLRPSSPTMLWRSVQSLKSPKTFPPSTLACI